MRTKNDTVKEADIIDNKKRKSTTKYVVALLFIIMIVAALVIALNNVGLLKIPGVEIKKKAELNYTETTNKVKEGVYMTDVSEIVEAVMPSIVSITSKTLVNSGNFGPSFFGNNEDQYSEGAGSGIIASPYSF